jgi:hypothetical protein
MWRPSTQVWPDPVGRRSGLIALVVLLYAVIVTSHQLTPVILFMEVTALVLLRQTSARGLPILMAVLLGTWVSFQGIPFLAVNIGSIAGHVGQVNNTVDANVVQRLQGSPGHVLVVNSRLAMTAALWGLAFIGAIRRFLQGYRDWVVITLALVPFSLLVLESYGGEMLSRAYFFALPFMAFFVASLFFNSRHSEVGFLSRAAIVLVSLLLLGGFFVARYGNERSDNFTQQDLDAVRELYAVAEPGSLLVTGVPNLPWQFQDFEKYDYSALINTSVADQLIANPADVSGAVNATYQMMADPKHLNSYLIITRSEVAYIELFQPVPPDSFDRFETALRQSPQFVVLYQQGDALILKPFVKPSRTTSGTGP